MKEYWLFYDDDEMRNGIRGLYRLQPWDPDNQDEFDRKVIGPGFDRLYQEQDELERRMDLLQDELRRI